MKKRLSKFELIRLIAMYLIVLHHSIVHGVMTNIRYDLIHYPASASISFIFSAGGKVGVYLFILITGYFTVNSSGITIKKIIKVWFPVFFWSVVLGLIFGKIFTTSYGNFEKVKIIIQMLFPILFNQYWFVTVYFFMYLLSPILNLFINWVILRSNRIKYFIILAVLLLSGSNPKILGGDKQIGNWLVVFCVIYCIGGVIRKIDILNKKNIQRVTVYALLIVTMLNIAIIIGLISILQIKFSNVVYEILRGLLESYPCLFLGIIEAICIFIVIGSSKLRYNKYINKLSAVSFGIYLISDNKYVSPVIWKGIFNMKQMIEWSSAIMALSAIFISLGVFLASGLLEGLRQRLFSHFENRLAKSIQKKVYKLLKL